MTAIVLALVIVGGVLGLIDVVRSKGQSLTAWGVVALSLAGVVYLLAEGGGKGGL